MPSLMKFNLNLLFDDHHSSSLTNQPDANNSSSREGRALDESAPGAQL